MSVEAASLTGYVEEYRRALDRLVGEALADLGVLRFDAKNAQHVAATAIYVTILQSVAECTVLLREPTAITVGTIARSVLESYADLCAVLKNASYIERMLATFTNEKRRLLRNIRKSPENSYHKEIAEKIDVAADLPTLEAELHGYIDRGYPPLRQDERFQAAGEEVEALYGSLYWQLCLEGHNDIIEIERRHVAPVGDGRAEVRIFEPRTEEELIARFDPLLGILADASSRIHGFLQTGKDGKYRECTAQLTTLAEAALRAADG